MYINSANQNLDHKYQLMSLLLGDKGQKIKPIASKSEKDIVAANRAKYFDENGEIINSNGMKGMYIGGGKDWKKIVSVSDEVKEELTKIVKEDFIRTNGEKIPESSRRNQVIVKYLGSLSADKRSRASWTLSQFAGEYADHLAELVKKNNPGWKPGDSFDSGIFNSDKISLGIDQMI